MNSNSTTETSQINRRQFLASVGAAGLSIFALGSAAASSAIGADAAASPGLSLASMRLLAGSKFVINTDDGPIRATLDAITEDRICSACEQFTATFSLAERATDLDSAVYKMRHPKLGNISLLLAPTESRGVMTASFCHLVG